MVARADLVVVPTRPSPHDLRAVGATVDIAEERGIGVVFVINDATPRARITSEAAVALSQHGVVAPVTIHNRVDFAASMIDGRTVGEVTPQSRSAAEIRELWTYISGRLQRAQGMVRSEVAQPAPSPSMAAAMPDHDDLDSESQPEAMYLVAPTPVAPSVEMMQSASPGLDDGRSEAERRQAMQSRASFGGGDRRVDQRFGRRAAEKS